LSGRTLDYRAPLCDSMGAIGERIKRASYRSPCGYSYPILLSLRRMLTLWR